MYALTALVDLTKTTAAMVDLTKSASDADVGEEEEVEAVGVVLARNGNPKVPPGWPMVPPAPAQPSKRRKGGQRIFDNIAMENSAKLHLKKKKRKMSKRELREREVARATAKVIEENMSRADEVGREVARGFGVTPSQTSAFVNGETADRDGDMMDNQQMLRAFRRMKTSQESDSDSDSEDTD